MHPDLQNLVELQRLDDAIRALEAEIASLPRRIAEVESTLSAHIRQVESDRNVLAENQRSRRRREGEIAVLHDKISHFKDQSLLVKTNEQYKALLHEIEFHESKIRQIEDEILAEMIESESLERKLREAEARLAEERRVVQGEIAQAEQQKSRDESELERLRAERAAIQSRISEPAYETYQRIARARKGVAVVGVTDGTCGACHVHLRPQVFSELMTNEQVHTCESCGRILYYLPPPPEAAASAPETSAGRES